MRILPAKLALSLYFLAVAQALYARSPAGNDLPKWDKVQQIVESELAKLSNYQPGDLVTKEQTLPIFPALKKAGWEVADQDEILAVLPSGSEMFVDEMRSSKAGRKYMRQISKYPLAFDRMDRLSRMPMAQQNVEALIRGPDGYKMLQYMTQTQWGKNLGNQLSNGPGGANFNAPTGRIYTQKPLLERLKQSYEAEKIARRK